MVVWPVVIRNSAIEVSFCVVCVSFGCIDNQVLVFMFFIQIGRDLFYWISIHRFNPTRWIGHSYYVLSYVS